MPDHSQVYKSQTEQYDRLISRQRGLEEHICEIQPIDQLNIVDLGAGTGRLTCELAPKAASVIALDSSAEMLEVTARKLEKLNISNTVLKVADHRQLPLPNSSADLLVSGWSVCYLASSNQKNWRENISLIMSEAKRVLKPGGRIILFETLGTGTETPNPPEFLKPYYAVLENEYGFSHKSIRTDYHFKDTEEAEELTRFFFGDQLADWVKKEQLVVVPECAGIWWL